MLMIGGKVRPQQTPNQKPQHDQGAYQGLDTVPLPLTHKRLFNHLGLGNAKLLLVLLGHDQPGHDVTLCSSVRLASGNELRLPNEKSVQEPS